MNDDWMDAEVNPSTPQEEKSFNVGISVSLKEASRLLFFLLTQESDFSDFRVRFFNEKSKQPAKDVILCRADENITLRKIENNLKKANYNFRCNFATPNDDMKCTSNNRAIFSGIHHEDNIILGGMYKKEVMANNIHELIVSALDVLPIEENEVDRYGIV